MRYPMNYSWRRFSDQAQEHAHAAGRQVSPPKTGDSQQRQMRACKDAVKQPAVCAAPPRILIVDNDIQSASSLELMVHACGHSQTQVAYSGHAALAIAAEFRPTWVLVELGLVDMSGHEVARSLRERAQGHDLRMIALTWSREHAGRELAGVAGFERYLLKPVAAPDLLELLQVPDRDRAAEC